MKKIIKKIATMTLIFSLLLAIVNVSASETLVNENITETYALGKGIIEFTENDDLKLVKYYENKKCLQESLFIKATGDIYYNDSTLKVSEEKTLNDIDILNFNYVEKYNVSDFITVITKPISKPSTLRLSWNQLDIFNYYDEYNDWYYGYLFGASYMNGPYQSLNWSWAIGFSVTTICGILSMIPGIATILPGVVGISSGLITAPLSVTEWRKDYIWEYKVVQSSPETFVGYTAPYVWKSETRYDLNNGNTDYAQTSFNPYYYSSSFRDTLMHSIAYYFIY